MKKSTSKKTRFEFETAPGSAVSVVGTFNEWDPAKHPMKDNPDSGKYVATVALPEGRHEYKFVVNGEWYVDPNCPVWAQNDCGTMNSVLQV